MGGENGCFAYIGFMGYVQNGPKYGQNGSQQAPNGPKQSDTVKRNGNCDQIPRRGTANGIDLRSLGRQVPILDRKRGLKVPFAAKFGRHLRVLAVFSGPVHSSWAQSESKWLKTGPKMTQIRFKVAQNGSK